MTLIDYIVLVLLALFTFDGMRKGFVRSFIPILSFTICSIIAIFSFDLSNNIIKAFLIVTIGSLVLTVIASVPLIIARQKLSPEEQAFIFWGSRALGGWASLFWKGIILTLGMVLITLLPNTLFGENLKESIRNSRTYFYTDALLITPTPVLMQAKESLNALNHPGGFEPIRESAEYQGFMKDPMIEAVLNDKTTLEQMNKKDVLGLMANPKIQQVLNDEKLMQKFTKLSDMVYTLKAH